MPHRLLRDLARGIRDIARGATLAHDRLRKRIATALLLTLLLDAVGTAVMYSLEHGDRRSDISTVWQAFFWVSAQLLTVSSQMSNPVTDAGRVMDLVLELWAITIVTTLAGSIAAFFHASDS
jgi:TctA family transporter